MDKLTETDVPIIILLGTLVMTILDDGIGLFILLYQQRALKDKERIALQELEFQSRMIKMQFESQEQERKRIGADLHDSLGSLLWGAKVNASLIQKIFRLEEKGDTEFKELYQILDEGLEVVKRIAWELTPEAFQDSGFSVSVAKLCDRFNGRGIKIKIIENNGKLWNDNRALQTFRIVQELLSNAIKHSKASVLEISISWLSEEIRIIVCDDGIGIKEKQDKKGLGLWNIHQRVHQVNGKVKMGVPPTGTGLEVDIRIPLFL
jgi:two-component system NarL family sensor kinase